MEPIVTTIVAALAAGATAALKDVGSKAVSDAYQGLKSLIAKRYGAAKAAAEAVDKQPEPASQEALAQQLKAAGADTDQEAKAAAQTLLDAIYALRDDAKATALFDFDRLRAARNLEISDVEATGTIFRARDAKIQGDFKISGIRQGPAPAKSKKN